MSALLSLQGIGKSFGGLAALSEISFDVLPGEIVGVIGPNGAGKTTLFNVVTAVFPPTAGEVRFDGERISGLPPHAITKRGITRTFQNIRLFSTMTVGENVMVGRHCRTGAGVLRGVLRTAGQRREEREIRGKARELLDLVGLSGADPEMSAGSL
ncbi:MAG: lptB 1, partial [Deltaproteobacteria bacterium]|nr:lptB 1 [Deltaproteobacteria bacterium]